ncbi:CynX/NimT family MFS transporter [Nocardioides sp. SYSU D00038]|uniref:MFS transporter n=1 Tax=Nocardioides sp. SYSU D00038 TaxID=2812554 RepID=UPI00196833F5|nr:MFS transporter [Nocardioides sp. SYSU D00038]
MTASPSLDRGARTEDDADWVMLLLAWLLYFSFALTVASLAPIVGTVRSDLDLSYGEVGLVLGGWQLTYLAAAFPVGYLVDRFDPRWVLFGGALFVAGSQLARSLATGFPTLLAAVALLGLGGPVMSVGLPKVVAEFFTGRSRATASGVYMTGAHVGHATALASTAVLVAAVGDWRIALRCYAVVVVVIAVAWVVTAKPVSRGDVGVRTPLLAGTWHVARAPGFWVVVAIGFAGFLGSHGYRNWLPTMLADAGMSATRAGVIAALPALLGILGSIVVLQVGAGRHRRTTTIVLLLVVSVSMTTATLVEGPLLYLTVGLEGFCAAALVPLMMNTLMELPEIGPRHVGAAAAVYFTVGELGGFAGPTLVGAVVGATGTFTAGVGALSFVMAAMVLVAVRMPQPKTAS